MRAEGGYDIASKLGSRALWHRGGCDGLAYLLEDHRVLKITHRDVEAAVALAIMAEQARGNTHPSVPRIDAVYRFANEHPCEHPECDEGCTSLFAILREGFDDLFETAHDADPADHAPVLASALESAMSDLDYAWNHDCLEHLETARTSWARYSTGRELEEVLDGVRWVKEKTGAHLQDIRLANVGYGSSRAVGLRDLGRALVPQHLLDAVRTLSAALF